MLPIFANINRKSEVVLIFKYFYLTLTLYGAWCDTTVWIDNENLL